MARFCAWGTLNALLMLHAKWQKGHCIGLCLLTNLTHKHVICTIKLAHWRDKSAQSLNTRRDVSKIIPNSPVLRNYYKFNSIVANKGRIYKELRYFWGISSNSIKLDNELRWDIRYFNTFIKITSRWIYWIKNHSIWIKTHEEIKKRKSNRISERKERENQN